MNMLFSDFIEITEQIGMCFSVGDVTAGENHIYL